MNALAAMPEYETYIETGISWLGCVPESWAIKPLKTEANIVLGKMLCSDNKGGYFLKPYLKSKNIQWLNVDVSSVDEMWFSKSELEQYRLVKGDLILSEGGEVGKTCIWNNDLAECYIQNSAHKVSVKENHNSKYFLYLMFACGKAGYFDAIVNRVSIAHLTRDKLVNVRFVFPSLQEQTSIANFLDQKTAQIDEAIAIKEQQISLLKERKQIIIQKAVTQGLNPNAPMKDSGVDWMGEIPEKWDVFANRALFSERVEKGREGLPLLSVSIHSGVSSEEISEEENVRGRVKIEDRRNYILVKTGDIAFNMMRAWQGGIGAVSTNGMVSPAYIVAKPKPRINSEYFELQYRCPEFIQQMDRYSKGITDFRKRLYWDSFKQLYTVVPPIDEQIEIIKHVKIISDKTETGVNLLSEQIEKLKEYKTTLINSAVTGKIKVA